MAIRIRVFDSRIARMNYPGGDIYKWTRNFVREVEAEAVVLAPASVGQPGKSWSAGRNRRTGRFYSGGSRAPRAGGTLKRSHSSSVSGNALGVFGNVTNSAPYARYVHEGTGRIFPHGPHNLYFFYNGRWHSKESVAGQRANPWLADALRRVGEVHHLV